MNDTRSYVNREAQIDDVEEKIKRVRGGEIISEPVMEWYGIPGIGKTTLVKQVVGDVCERSQAPFAYVDFGPQESVAAKQDKFESRAFVLRHIAKNIFADSLSEFEVALDDYLEAAGLSNEALCEIREKKVLDLLLGYIKKRVKDGLVIVAFDTTEKANPELAAWVEEEIVSPLALTGKSLILWAGRFPRQWRRFEVRKRLDSQKLEPLRRKATVEQGGAVAIDLFPYTFGHPLSTERLRKIIREKPEKRTFDENLLIRTVDDVVDQYVMAGLNDALKAACRTLAVLRQFDLVILKRLLSEFVPDFEDTTSFLGTLRGLTETSLVEWNSIRKGYTLDKTLRHILAQYLRITQPARYLRINERAAEIYQTWIAEARDNRGIYVLEHLYHQAIIATERGETAVADLLQEILQQHLCDYYADEDPVYAIKATTQLHEELDQDQELQTVIGERGFETLKEIVYNHRVSLEHTPQQKSTVPAD